MAGDRSVHERLLAVEQARMAVAAAGQTLAAQRWQRAFPLSSSGGPSREAGLTAQLEHLAREARCPQSQLSLKLAASQCPAAEAPPTAHWRYADTQRLQKCVQTWARLAALNETESMAPQVQKWADQLKDWQPSEEAFTRPL